MFVVALPSPSSSAFPQGGKLCTMTYVHLLAFPSPLIKKYVDNLVSTPHLEL